MNCPGVQSNGTCPPVRTVRNGVRHIFRGSSGRANCVRMYASSSGKRCNSIVELVYIKIQLEPRKHFDYQCDKSTNNEQKKGPPSGGDPFHTLNDCGITGPAEPWTRMEVQHVPQGGGKMEIPPYVAAIFDAVTPITRNESRTTPALE